MELASLILSAVAVCLIVVILIFIWRHKANNYQRNTDNSDINKTLKDSFDNMSSFTAKLIAKENEVIMDNLNHKVDLLTSKIDGLISSYQEEKTKQAQFKDEMLKLLHDNIDKFNTTIYDFINRYTKDSAMQKDEIMEKLSAEIKEFNNAVKVSLESFDKSMKEKLNDFKVNTNDSIKGLSDTLEKNLNDIRKDSNEKLEKINESINEKLQKTLEEKLQDSFKSVVQGIGDVNKAVGEIKGLANDVGSLKSVLTNVKTKGIMGEVILGNIIREFLTESQYEENVITKKSSKDRVEFAIKLPGKKDDTIYLPVDSKFPYESYSIIHESSSIDEINEAKKRLRHDLLTYAKSVSEKYISVPDTTDFAILFLPLEGLYLEALNMGLFEEIQNKYKVNLTGPTTFTAFINSLNMGFRSLLIQKKSADVFKLLGAVKSEFATFATTLAKTQKKVNEAAFELENLVGTRTRMINSKLKTIDALDIESAKLLLEDKSDDLSDR